MLQIFIDPSMYLEVGEGKADCTKNICFNKHNQSSMYTYVVHKSNHVFRVSSCSIHNAESETTSRVFCAPRPLSANFDPFIFVYLATSLILIYN